MKWILGLAIVAVIAAIVTMQFGVFSDDEKFVLDSANCSVSTKYGTCLVTHISVQQLCAVNGLKGGIDKLLPTAAVTIQGTKNKATVQRQIPCNVCKLLGDKEFSARLLEGDDAAKKQVREQIFGGSLPNVDLNKECKITES